MGWTDENTDRKRHSGTAYDPIRRAGECENQIRSGGITIKKLKNPTREQKILMQKRKLKPEDWMVERDTPEELVLVHRYFNTTKRVIPKGEKYDTY